MERRTLEFWDSVFSTTKFNTLKTQFQSKLVEWFLKNGRDLPWRKTRDPYKILVSEIMLQQTQVDRVIEYWNRFLEKLPDFSALAQSSEDQLLELWSGLGYYNRVRNLQKCAQIITEQYHGEFPKTREEILKLPGIGEYTAGAVMTFALEIRAPIVDTNVDRVLRRIFLHPVKSWTDSEKTKILWKLSNELLPETNFWEFNQGIMDFGAMVCIPEKPRCNVCPFTSFCKYYKHHSITRFFG